MPEQRVMMITGAAGGIGRACVKLFTEKDWKVIGIDRNDFGEGFPEGGLFIKADISLESHINTIFEETKKYTDTLDALINNAAHQVNKSILDVSVEEWDLVMASNLRSVFLASKLAHPLLAANGGGAIVNTSSVHAIQTSGKIAAYAASKGGLLALTRQMAIDFAQYDIRVNAILPGAVDTPMLRNGLGRGHLTDGSMHERLENLASKTVNGRVGRPEEIAHGIYFLADNEQSSFMTGQSLVVDGGATCRLSTE
jgi:glucose 1-dehydrogenase